jgi:hypothetical protein
MPTAPAWCCLLYVNKDAGLWLRISGWLSYRQQRTYRDRGLVASRSPAESDSVRPSHTPCAAMSNEHRVPCAVCTVFRRVSCAAGVCGLSPFGSGVWSLLVFWYPRHTHTRNAPMCCRCHWGTELIQDAAPPRTTAHYALPKNQAPPRQCRSPPPPPPPTPDVPHGARPCGVWCVVRGAGAGAGAASCLVSPVASYKL